jgi:rsbT co-antagonist protein RsbR
MAATETKILADLVSKSEKEILPEWMELQKKAGSLQTGRITEAELAVQSAEFLHLLRNGLDKGAGDVANSAYTPAREFLTNLSRSRASQGFSPSETAAFVFSLKQPLFNTLNRDKAVSPADVATTTWTITTLLDALGLTTFEAYQRAVDAGGEIVGGCAGAPGHRYARQRAHAGRHGESASAHRR